MTWIPTPIGRARCRARASGARRLLRAVVLALAAAVPAAAAQEPTPVIRADAELMLRVETRHRWIPGSRSVADVMSTVDDTWVQVDSVRADGAGRRLHVSIRGNVTGTIVLGPGGRTEDVRADVRERARTGWPRLDADYERQRFAFSGHVRLPVMLLREFAAAARLGGTASGARWADTIRIEATYGPTRQLLEGVRHSTVAGDTVVESRRLLIVRDSMIVRYVEEWEARERTLDTIVAYRRTAEGSLRGRTLVDPAGELPVTRSDTMRLAGSWVLSYPDGRRYEVPVTYERSRRYDLHDRASYAAYEEARRRERRSRVGGLLRVPGSEIDKRIAAGDAGAVDSLLGLARRVTDADERRRVLAPFMFLQDSVLEARVDSTLRAFPNEAAWIQSTIQAVWHDRQVTAADVQRLLPYLRDPGRALRLGLERDPFYEHLRQALLMRMPALQQDTSSWACTPAACALLAGAGAGADTTLDSRLHDLALIARFALDPRRWADTVLAREAAGSALVADAASMIRGVGATWPAAAGVPLPPENSDFRAWHHWMIGQRPDSARATSGGDALRFEDSHEQAVRIHERISGREVAAEMRRAYDSATSDSARLVFGLMLMRLDELRMSPAEIERLLRSESPEQQRLGRAALTIAMRRDSEPADPRVASELAERLLLIQVGAAPRWRELTPREPRRTAPPESTPHYVVAETLPAPLRERWTGPLRLITRAQAAVLPREPHSVLTLTDIRQLGPFVELAITVRTIYRGDRDQTLSAYAHGDSYILLRAGAEWVIVSAGGWVT